MPISWGQICICAIQIDFCIWNLVYEIWEIWLWSKILLTQPQTYLIVILFLWEIHLGKSEKFILWNLRNMVTEHVISLLSSLSRSIILLTQPQTYLNVILFLWEIQFGKSEKYRLWNLKNTIYSLDNLDETRFLFVPVVGMFLAVSMVCWLVVWLVACLYGSFLVGCSLSRYFIFSALLPWLLAPQSGALISTAKRCS